MKLKIKASDLLQRIREHSTLKQFIISLLSTTVSIALTFGISSFIDNRKKETAKHELVLMVMCDMRNSLESIREAQRAVEQSLKAFTEVPRDTSMRDESLYDTFITGPTFEYTETAERIFTTNVETINTIGNLFFVENVSEFYWTRKKYKELISSIVELQLKKWNGSLSWEELADSHYLEYCLACNDYYPSFKQIYEQCLSMMSIDEKDMNDHIKARTDLY